MIQVWISAAGLCGATILGAIIGFLFKGLSHKWNDIVLGYSAGIMLAASTLGLIAPAFNMYNSIDWWMIVAGIMAGALFLSVLDLVTPHLHTITGLDPEEHHNNAKLNHIMLFVMAVALHKLPEGMAAGVSMNEVADGDVSWAVSFGIALQNIPEGMIIIAPLLLAGVSRIRTMVISMAIGLLEVAGVWIGYGLGVTSVTYLPVMLGFAGGSMLYVTFDEMIPETHAHGYQKYATYALILGYITLMLLEKMFE